MPKNLDDIKIGTTFDIKEAVDLTDDAAQRTRWISIILVVATIIVFVGFYNSTPWSWANHRIESIYNNEYIPRINPSGETAEKPLLDAYFSSSDFSKKEGSFDAFACRFYAGGKIIESSLSGYLYDRFNGKTQALLKEKCEGSSRPVEKIDGELLPSLVVDLNLILKDKFLYKDARFAGVHLREETENYVRLWKEADKKNESLPQKDLIRFNRLLLEDAYPNEILKSRDLIPVDGDDNGNIVTPGQKWRLDRQNETTRSDIDNIENIKIPFIGIAIDVNDLGTIGGLSLTIILLLLRYSLSREIKNLNVSLKEAFCHHKLNAFYHWLAMRQVLTVPQMKGEIKNHLLAVGSKIILLFPLLVMFLGVVYDYYSVFWLSVFEFQIVYMTLIFEAVFLICIFYLSLRCMERQIHIDGIWDEYWKIIDSGKLPELLISDEFLKSDNPANKELIKIINTRITDVPQEDKAWLYDLMSRVPGFISWAYHRTFTRKRLAKWIPTKYLQDKVLGKDKTKETGESNKTT